MSDEANPVFAEIATHVDEYGYTPVFIAYGVMPLIAASLVLFVMGPLRPLPEFQNSDVAEAS
jgi:hypothetical protein